MATEVGAKVQVEFSSVGQMRKAIKEATSDLIAMQEQFGKTSPQAIAAAKRIAELKDRIQDAKEQADLFDPGKRFSAFANAANQIAAGFSAVQGAMALVGTESEDLQKTLVKVQGAIALSQGLSQLKDLGKAYDELKVVAVDAFSSTRKALMSVGIGVLAIALTAIIANWEKFRDAVFKLIPGLQTVSKFIGNLVTSFTDLVGITSEAERNLDKLSKTNKKVNETIDAQIQLLEAQGGKEEEIYNLKKQRAENELNVLRESLKVKGKLSEDELKQFRELKNQQQILDIQESNRIKKANEDRAKEQQEAAKKAAADRKAANEKAAKDAEDARKLVAEKAAAADKVLDDARRAKLTEQQREEEDAIRAFEERKKTLAAAGITDLTAITEQREMELAAIRKKYADEEAAKKAEADQKESERLAAAHENTRQMVAEQNAALLQAEIELQNQRFNAAQAGLQLLESLAGENERIANLIFAVQKGLEIARIVTDTARGIVAAKAGLAAVPPFIGFAPNPAFIIAAGVAAKQIAGLKIAAAVSIASIAAASIAKFKRGGSAGSAGGGGVDVAGGGAAPVAAQPSPTVTATAVNTQAVNNLGNQAMRAYVLNSDITNNEQRNAYLQRNARLG